MTAVKHQSRASDFDFLIGSWDVANRRRNGEGSWEEFAATTTVTQHVDGTVQVDHFDSPGLKAVTVRAFDPATGRWSMARLSNEAPPDFRPLVGGWSGDDGEFLQTIETDDGWPLDVRFRWKRLGPDRARWEQALSLDAGGTWDRNWTMELIRRAR